MRSDDEKLAWVRERLQWMDHQDIWPHGGRYLWTDAFGVVLLASLYDETGDQSYLGRAEWVVDDVDRVLGRDRGLRIGEAPDRDGQYYHYLALTECDSAYREVAVELVREIHSPFVAPDRGVYWKMTENLERPYPGVGTGPLDAFDGYVVYRLIDEEELAPEIEQMKAFVDRDYEQLAIEQDLALGMMLWLTHFFPHERWARLQRERCLATLEEMWVDPPGYFCRRPGMPETKFRFTNYGVAIGLEAIDKWSHRVERLKAYFGDYQSGDAYDTEAITHVMECCAHYPGLLVSLSR